MSRSRVCKLLVAFSVVATAISVAVRVYAAFVPVGAEPIPYLLAKVEGGVIKSPNGVTYEIWFNDRGAMHSGPHWTWVVSNHLLWGKRIVTEGFLGPQYAGDDKKINVTWDGDSPVIQFLPDRH